jgi:hypothetical protein
VLQVFHLAGRDEHLLLGTPVEHTHGLGAELERGDLAASAGRLSQLHGVGAESGGGAGAVHGGKSAADDQHVRSKCDLLPLTNLEQEIHAVLNAAQLFAGKIQVVGPEGASRQDDGVVLGFELRQGHVATQGHAAADLDAGQANLLDLQLDDLAWQAEFGNVLHHHAARPLVLLQHDHAVSEQGQVARGGQSGRTAANDDDALSRRRCQRWQDHGFAGAVIGG